jgi:hypothetical protein
MPDLTPIHFFDEHIEVIFDVPPVREKSRYARMGLFGMKKLTACLNPFQSGVILRGGERWQRICVPRTPKPHPRVGR